MTPLYRSTWGPKFSILLSAALLFTASLQMVLILKRYTLSGTDLHADYGKCIYKIFSGADSCACIFLIYHFLSLVFCLILSVVCLKTARIESDYVHDLNKNIIASRRSSSITGN